MFLFGLDFKYTVTLLVQSVKVQFGLVDRFCRLMSVIQYSVSIF